MTRSGATGASPWVDPDDAPELTAAWFERAEIRDGEKVVRRGRPPSGRAKKQVTIRLDPDVIEGLRATGPGWQTVANAILRAGVLKKSGKGGLIGSKVSARRAGKAAA